ncbi:hypothetical protein [Gordonia iterans]
MFSTPKDHDLLSDYFDVDLFAPSSDFVDAAIVCEGDDVVLRSWARDGEVSDLGRVSRSEGTPAIDEALCAGAMDSESAVADVLVADIDSESIADEPSVFAEIAMFWGWRVSLTREPDCATVRAVPPPEPLVDTASQWEAYGVARGSLVEMCWARVADGWVVSSERSGAREPSGELIALDSETIEVLLALLAPESHSSVVGSMNAGWHSDGSLTPGSFLADEFLKDVGSPDERTVAARLDAISEWTSHHGLLGPFDSVSNAVGACGAVGAGHYLVVFDKGECYIGQTSSFRQRLADHRQTWGDEVRGYYVRPDTAAAGIVEKGARSRRLVQSERYLIHDAQTAKLVARNFRDMAHPINPHRDFEEAIAPMSADDWFSDPVGANAADDAGLRRFDAREYAGSRTRYADLGARPDGGQVVGLVRDYLTRCMPYPVRTESTTWSVSCLPTSLRGGRGERSKVLACISISWTEVLTVGHRVDGSGDWALLAVNDLELGGLDRFGELRLLRRHPEVSIEPATHKEFGPGVSLLHVEGLRAMERLLDDVEVTRAAATVALRLNRIGRSMQRTVHNPFLVAAALGRERS